MKKLKSYIPSVFAVVLAFLVSIFLFEETIIILSCLAVGLVALVVVLVRCTYTKRSRWRAFVLTLIPAVLFIVIAWSHASLRLIFGMYRAEFDRVALQIEAGRPPATPFWIGPFKIKMADRRGPTEPPYLSSNHDEWEIDGFVRHPHGQGFNLWSCITLDDEWSYIAED